MSGSRSICPSWERLSLGLAAALLALTILFTVVYTIGAGLLLRGMGSRASLFKIYLVITGAGAAGLVSDPKLGIPLRVFFYRAILGVSVAVASGAVLLETLIWFITMGFILMAPIPQFWSTRTSWIPPLSVLCISAAFIAGLILAKLAAPLTRYTSRPIVIRIVNFFSEIRSALGRVEKGKLLLAVLLFACTYVLDACCLYLVLEAMGVAADLIRTDLHHRLFLPGRPGHLTAIGLGSEGCDLRLSPHAAGGPHGYRRLRRSGATGAAQRRPSRAGLDFHGHLGLRPTQASIQI